MRFGRRDGLVSFKSRSAGNISTKAESRAIVEAPGMRSASACNDRARLSARSLQRDCVNSLVLPAWLHLRLDSPVEFKARRCFSSLFRFSRRKPRKFRDRRFPFPLAREMRFHSPRWFRRFPRPVLFERYRRAGAKRKEKKRRHSLSRRRRRTAGTNRNTTDLYTHIHVFFIRELRRRE